MDRSVTTDTIRMIKPVPGRSREEVLESIRRALLAGTVGAALQDESTGADPYNSAVAPRRGEGWSRR